MYIYHPSLSDARSLIKANPTSSWYAQYSTYSSDQSLNGFWDRLLTNFSFSSSCDRSVATPSFSPEERRRLTNLLSPSQSAKAIQWNVQAHPAKSGVRPEDIATDLTRYVDFDAVRVAIQQSGGSYTLNKGIIDAVFVEAAHQFQAKVYFHKTEQDGGVGPSTLDSLGIMKHKWKPKIGMVYGHQILMLQGMPGQISNITGGEFTANNWYDFIAAPSFLGHRINKYSQGIHILLLRKLREAESYLLSLPAYAGMTPVALGRALGLARESVYYSGGRISNQPQSLHGFGLALDIDVKGNPWIGAGWIKDDKAGRDWLVEQIKTRPDDEKRRYYQRLLNIRNERYRLVETLRSAAQGSFNGVTKGSTIFTFLHTLAVQYGRKTRSAYDVLSRRNEDFKTFLRNHPSELLFWKNSATFDNRDPLNGFLNLHADLVSALRQVALLAWGAIDFGASACGDIMHFDLRTLGVGRVIANRLGAYVPEPGHHPVA